MPLTRRFCFAGTYHRETPGSVDRHFADDDEVQSIHAGGMDPLGFGWAAYELMVTHGFDVVQVLHDKDASALKEVQRVKHSVRTQRPELNLSECSCGGSNFKNKATSSLSNAEKVEVEEHPDWNGVHYQFCQECDDGSAGYCHGCTDINCIRHGKVNLRKGIAKARTRLININLKIKKKNADAQKKFDEKKKKKKEGDPELVAPTAVPLTYPELEGLNQSKHELWKNALQIGKYVARLWDQSLIWADGDVDIAEMYQEYIDQHMTGNHNNEMCKRYAKCQEEDYEQTMVLTDPATLVVVRDVLKRWGMRKNLLRYVNRMDTNALESVNSLTIRLLQKITFSQNSCLYQCVAKFVLIHSNEGGWVSIRLVCEALGLHVTPALSNYLTRLEQIAEKKMATKNGTSGKTQRNELRNRRQSQVAATYLKGIEEGKLRPPGAARSWGGSSTSSPLVIMDSDRESGEEDETEKDYVTTDAHGKIIWNDSSDDEEDQMGVDGEGGEAGGAGGEDVVFELELLQYCEDKPSRELGVDEMPQKSGRPRRTIKLNRYDAYTY